MKTNKQLRNVFQWLSLPAFMAVLYSCGGGASTSSEAAGVRGTGNGVVTLAWTPPTTNVDGTALDDLAGYRIYYGNASGAYSNMIDLNTPGLSSYVVENLPVATYYFAATAYDADNNESVYSNEVSMMPN